MIEPGIVVYLFLLLTIIQLGYYLFIFTKIGKVKPEPVPVANPEPVSIIICARNERENLEKNLDAFMNQDLKGHEVILVDDGSTDGTKALLEDFEKKYSHLRVVTLEIDDRFRKGKKFALTMGIKAARNPIILLSDADCVPDSDQWARKMTAGLHNGKEVALGVSMFPPATSFLTWIIRIETFHTAMQYVNYALWGMPYMGVGRNLAYRKDLFFKVKGFASHQHLMSGDDDLFVNETATEENTNVIWDKEAQTTSIPKETFASWYRQKSRHFSTGRLYKKKHKRILAFYSFSLFLFYATAFYLVIDGASLLIPAIAFGTRFLVQGIVSWINMKQLNVTKLIWGYPFFDLVILFIQVFVGIKGTLSKPKTWK